MHSKIFQISNKFIAREDYASPSTYWDNSGDFADYIGDEITGEDRKDSLGYLADLLKDVFEHRGGGKFVYKGEESMAKFKQQWIDELLHKTAALTPDNMFKEQNLFRIGQLTERTHLNSSIRVDIEGWCGCAYPLGELFEWADSKLKKGDRFYIGAVIDYHW